MLWMG